MNYKNKQWLNSLDNALQSLLLLNPIPFSTLTPSKIPERAGVYLITEKLNKKETALYVGRTKNLRQRIYTNHLMGSITNARLKKYIINDADHSCFQDVKLAKVYIRKNCLVRWIFEDEIRIRGAIEGYLTAMLFPKYGIYEEH